MEYLSYISVTSLGCWGESESDRAISGDFGKLDKASCYETTKSLGYSVFAINNGSNCHTSPSAWTTYKKYGPLECNNSRANEVFQIKKGNRDYGKLNLKLLFILYFPQISLYSLSFDKF